MTIAAAHAHRLIIVAQNRFAAASHRFVGGGVDRYAEAHLREIQDIIDRATARTEVAAVMPNGLRKMRAYDGFNELVAEWTDGPAK